MNKLFLTLLSIASLNLSLTASDLPSLSALEAALPQGAAAQELDPTEALIEAVEAHDATKAQKALEQGAQGEHIALGFLAHTGDTAILKLLTEHLRAKKLPLDLDQQTEKGESPVYLACKYGHSDTAEFLLNAGASPYLTITVTDFFHTKRDTALNIACKKCPRSTVELLLRKGGHQLINTTNEHGRSCLHDLCNERVINVNTLRLLLENGGDVNLQDNRGNTPFHYACHAKQDEHAQKTALELLMQHGADTTILNQRGMKAYPCGILLDITTKRALDSSSDEAIQIMIQEKRAATAAAAAVVPALKQPQPIEIIRCCICLGEAAKDTKTHITLKGCNHIHDRECLASWIVRNASCPLCRSTDLTEKK